MLSFRLATLLKRDEKGQQRWDDEQGEDRRDGQAAENHTSQTPVELAAGPRGQHQGERRTGWWWCS
jgi:hypothetical protein